MRLRAAAVMIALLPMLLSAQGVAVGGTVVRDSLGHALGGATVTLPALKLTTRTNYLGEFRIRGVPEGRHAIEIRYVGFAPLVDSITAGGPDAEREFVMREQVVALDSVHVTAGAMLDFPFQREFEERRKMGLGKFFDGAELRTLGDNRNFMNFLTSRLPGFRLSPTNTADKHAYPASGRMACADAAFSCKQAGSCWVGMVVDGVPLYLPTVTITGEGPPPGKEPPNVGDLKSEDFAAVEYYAAGSSPPQYSGTGYQCGVLLLWRRSSLRSG